MVSVSNGESISTAFPAVAQGSPAIHFKFFRIHMISTERRRLSARYGGYPPAYTQVLHRLLKVIQRVPVQWLLNVIGWSFTATPGDYFDVSVKHHAEPHARSWLSTERDRRRHRMAAAGWRRASWAHRRAPPVPARPVRVTEGQRRVGLVVAGPVPGGARNPAVPRVPGTPDLRLCRGRPRRRSFAVCTAAEG